MLISSGRFYRMITMFFISHAKLFSKSWRCLIIVFILLIAHSVSELIIGTRLSPCSVSLYSTRIGTSGKTVLFNSPSASRICNVFDSTFEDMSGITIIIREMWIFHRLAINCRKMGERQSDSPSAYRCSTVFRYATASALPE